MLPVTRKAVNEKHGRQAVHAHRTLLALPRKLGAPVSFIPIDHNFAGRVRRVFRKQQVIRTLGVEILRLEPGEIELTMPFAPASNRTDSSTQGIITTALDARQRLRLCGLSLMPADAAVLTVEFKTNLIAPGQRRA